MKLEPDINEPDRSLIGFVGLPVPECRNFGSNSIVVRSDPIMLQKRINRNHSNYSAIKPDFIKYLQKICRESEAMPIVGSTHMISKKRSMFSSC